MGKKAPFGTYPPEILIDPVQPNGCDIQLTGTATIDGAYVTASIRPKIPGDPSHEYEGQVSSFTWLVPLMLPPGASGTWIAKAWYRDLGDTIIYHEREFTANCPRETQPPE